MSDQSKRAPVAGSTRINRDTLFKFKPFIRPEGFLRWPSSVCNQCCYTDLCGHLWTPAGRTEWAMDTREHTEMSYTFVIVSGDD